jgi:crotonobetainyl-CoA:carnitine CoA-transferase CaiB-like acyl-CoA transferase
MSIFKRKDKERVYTRYSTAGSGVSRWKETVEKLMTPEGRPDVFDDIVVLDASMANFSGIIAASFFAEFGAEVIKIEPAQGDPCRKMTPFGKNVKGVGIPFIMEGRNKRYMTLDLEQSAEERETFARLAQKAAVVIETFPAGRMDSWGIGYASLQKKSVCYIA